MPREIESSRVPVGVCVLIDLNQFEEVTGQSWALLSLGLLELCMLLSAALLGILPFKCEGDSAMLYLFPCYSFGL